MFCRFCGTRLEHMFVSLGMSPLANLYLTEEQLLQKEKFSPLDVYVCSQCFLVQLDQFENPVDIFSEYAYFSSYSEAWLKHSSDYADAMTVRFNLGSGSRVIEIASNDGYLLQYFIKKNIPVLGIEPANNIAQTALRKGIPTKCVFFGSGIAQQLASDGIKGDLVVGNNVLAHVPDLNDFVRGLKIILSPRGVITIEFPHLMSLVDHVQFDTIYHEHLSYFSFIAVEKIFSDHGLTIFDVEQIYTHGGSLRIYAKHQEDIDNVVTDAVSGLRKKEIVRGYDDISFYSSFQGRVEAAKKDILKFLIKTKGDQKTVAGYGAPAKGNTLLNYCGIGTDLIAYTVDRNPYKQGKFLPGSRIPVEHPDKISQTKPDYVFILPWNIKEEIMSQLNYIRDWGGKFIVPIPNVQVF